MTGSYPRPLADAVTLDAALDEQLAQAGFVLDRPVEADGLRLRPAALARLVIASQTPRGEYGA